MVANVNQPVPTSDPMRQREFHFTERDFQQLSALAARHAGIHVTEAKRELIYGRLARRLRHLGLKTFRQYCEFLESDNPREMENFVNAITTNLTSFFREAHHFHFLRTELLPGWLAEAQRSGSRSFRIWCAGCSTGEEPYTIAMTVMECLATGSEFDFQMVATDLDSDVLATAARGVYELDRIKDVEERYLKRWFLRGKGGSDGLVKISRELQNRIEFRQHNMVFDSAPEGAPFHAIFCRNVVIYFDKPTQNAVFEKFADALYPQGHLFVGHSESLFKKTERFRLVSQSTYQKTA